MVIFLAFVAAIFLALFIAAHRESRRHASAAAAARAHFEQETQRVRAETQATLDAVLAEVAPFRRYAAVADAETRAAEILREAQTQAEACRQAAQQDVARLTSDALGFRSQAQSTLAEAKLEAAHALGAARTQAQRERLATQEEAAATARRTIAAADTEAQRLRLEAADQAASLLVATEARDTAARARLASAQAEAEHLLRTARTESEALAAEATARFQRTQLEAEGLLASARARAEALAGEAFSVWADQTRLEQAVSTLHQCVHQTPLPVTAALVVDAAISSEETRRCEVARTRSTRLAGEGLATTCEHPDTYAREVAERAVREAFDARVDALLRRARPENADSLAAEMREAARRVNLNGESLHHAQLRPAYLEARLEELHATVELHRCHRRWREEQLRLRSDAVHGRGSVFLLLQPGLDGTLTCAAVAAPAAATPGIIAAVLTAGGSASRLAAMLEASLTADACRWPGVEALTSWATAHGAALRLTMAAPRGFRVATEPARDPLQTS